MGPHVLFAIDELVQLPRDRKSAEGVGRSTRAGPPRRVEPSPEERRGGLWTAAGRRWRGGRAAASGRAYGEARPPRPVPGKSPAGRSALSGHPKSHSYLNQQ